MTTLEEITTEIRTNGSKVRREDWKVDEYISLSPNHPTERDIFKFTRDSKGVYSFSFWGKKRKEDVNGLTWLIIE